MDLHISSRGMGKTTHLVNQSAKTGAVIVVLSEIQKESIFQRARFMELEIPAPITFDWYLRNKNGLPRDMKFLVDEAQFVLNDLFEGRIIGASINVNSETPLDIKLYGNGRK